MAKKKDEEKKALSRREFLKDTGMVVGGAALTMGALSLAGCAPEAETTTVTKATTVTTIKTETATPWLPSKWDYEADVVVVGAGGAGSCAAIAAHDAGADVIILEKMPEGQDGGATRVYGGVLGWKGVADFGLIGDIEAIRANSFYEIDERYAAAFSDALEDLSHWLLEEVRLETVGSIDNLLIVAMHDDYTGGHFVIQALKGEVNKRGIEVLYETPGKELIQDAVTKEILGVRAESKGSQINIKAKKGVVLANGGYSSNTQMLKILNLPGIYTATMNSPANSGDGQRMGQKVGARLWDIAMGAESSLCALKLPSQIYDTAVQYNGEISPGFIFVDKTGNRFMNEYDLTTWSHYKGHLAVFDFKGDFIMPPTQNEYLHIPFFAIFDDKHRRSGSLAGNLGGAWGRMGWFASQRLYDWSADNSAEIAKGWIVEADTIQELATKIKGTDHKGAQISVDAEGLQETVDKFNEYCAAGVDSSFGRAAMSPIDTPPYYGAELCIQTQYTTGGLKHDAQCRTLDLDDKPIPRLYSAGDVGHIGIIKPDGVCGAMAFGRVAGKQVAALEPWG